MSVKLGNTNIAGTQVLYSTTGNNTDGAMTQAITTTQLNLKADDTNVVHKTSDEIISGEKTFNNAINFANATWNAVGDDAFIGDMNQAGGVCIKGNNNSTGIYLYKRDETVSNGFYLDENDQNGFKMINPTQGANAWGSVTAMTSQSLSSNGYVKFNHGLIIQWGYTTNLNGVTQINFSTAFTSTNLGISFGMYYNGESYTPTIREVATTYFKYWANSNRPSYWIAVGY